MGIKYFKFLDHDGRPFNGGSGVWNWPKNGNPGRWMPKINKIIPCQSGYHLCEFPDILEWLGPEFFEAEGRGKFIRHENNKTVFQEARLIRKIESWNDKTIRFFAADCAEHVLHIFEKEYPKNLKPRQAIQAARDFANGKIGDTARAASWAAAWDAARAASWAAPWDTARAAAWDASWAAARAAAWAASWAAAWDASRAAARAAAWDAERKWQIELLEKILNYKE